MGGRNSAGDDVLPTSRGHREPVSLFTIPCSTPIVVSRIYFTKMLPGIISSEASFFCSMRVPPSLPPRGRQPKECAPLTPVVISKIFKQHSCPARPRLGGQATPKGGGPAHIRDYFGKSIRDRTLFYSHKQTSIILYFFAANLSENI